MAAEHTLNIEFVQEIEKYPCLYNFKLPEYMRKDATERAWGAIGNKFQLTGPQCKERWKNLRSVFVRHLKPLKSGSAASHKKPYYLADFMQFAIPYIKIPGNLKEPSQAKSYDDDQQSRSLSTQQSSLLLRSSQSILQQTPLPSTSSQALQEQQLKACEINRKKIEETQLEQVISSYFELKKAKMMENSDNGENSNKMFLLSLLPDINKMNDKQNRLFKRRVLEIIDDIMEQGSDVLKTPITLISTPPSNAFSGEVPTPIPIRKASPNP